MGTILFFLAVGILPSIIFGPPIGILISFGIIGITIIIAVVLEFVGEPKNYSHWE
jgi:hypothetical protein